MSEFRNDQLFVTKSVLKALRLVSKAKEYKCTDELANEILEGWLILNHPDVVEHVRAHYKAGEDFAKALHEKLKPKPAAFAGEDILH